MNHPVLLEGFFPVSTKDLNPQERLFLDPCKYVKSARTFDLETLHIVGGKHYVGSMFNAIEITGVVDTEGSLYPFYISKEKVEKLQKLIESVRPVNTKLL